MSDPDAKPCGHFLWADCKCVENAEAEVEEWKRRATQEAMRATEWNAAWHERNKEALAVEARETKARTALQRIRLLATNGNPMSPGKSAVTMDMIDEIARDALGEKR